MRAVIVRQEGADGLHVREVAALLVEPLFFPRQFFHLPAQFVSLLLKQVDFRVELGDLGDRLLKLGHSFFLILPPRKRPDPLLSRGNFGLQGFSAPKLIEPFGPIAAGLLERLLRLR